MLSRHADSLYWLARYVERAENTARLLEAAARLSAMPVAHAEGQNEWEMAVAATGTLSDLSVTYGEANARTVVEHLAFSQSNPSSIRSCLEIARTNARSVRTALTMDMWETINSGWLDMRKQEASARMNRQELSTFLSWAKEVSLRFDGSAYRTMLRNDAYYFLRLGTYIERADFTARILNVKASVLDPDRPSVGGGFDYYQWSWILRSVSALTSYHWVYRENLRPHFVAEFLILKEEMPRSLVSCYDNITRFLNGLARDYGRQGLSQRKARAALGRLQGTDMQGVFRTGLSDFLDDFIAENASIGSAIADQYLG